MRTESLHIDFAPGARRIPRSGLLLLLASTLLLGAGLVQGVRLVSERTRAEAAIHDLDARRTGGGAAKSAPLKPDPRQLALTRATRQVASDLMTPWATLLSSLGSTANQDVALLSVEPSVAKRSVRLTGEARDAHGMLAYVGALQHDSRLKAVVLVSHQVQVQAPGTPVRFQVQAQWGEPR